MEDPNPPSSPAGEKNVTRKTLEPKNMYFLKLK